MPLAATARMMNDRPAGFLASIARAALSAKRWSLIAPRSASSCAMRLASGSGSPLRVSLRARPAVHMDLAATTRRAYRRASPMASALRSCSTWDSVSCAPE